jgi:hypothetical protein
MTDHYTISHIIEKCTTVKITSSGASFFMFANMNKDVVAKACGHFRHRLKMVVTAEGGCIEK